MSKPPKAKGRRSAREIAKKYTDGIRLHYTYNCIDLVRQVERAILADRRQRKRRGKNGTK